MLPEENQFDDQTPIECWKWGIFYVNSKDTRVWVPKLSGLGYTLNFGHRIAYVIAAVILALIGVTIGMSFVGG